MGIQKLGSDNFDNMLNGADKPVIIDFYADWCGPCKMIAPLMEQIAEEYKDDLIIYKVNVDECPDISARYSVQSIPTFISFKNGSRHGSLVGAGSKQKILDLIN